MRMIAEIDRRDRRYVDNYAQPPDAMHILHQAQDGAGIVTRAMPVPHPTATLG